MLRTKALKGQILDYYVQSPIYEAQFKNQSKSKPNKKKKLAGRAYVMSLSFALFLHMISVTFLTPIPKHPFW
jgi:hypothetical protein